VLTVYSLFFVSVISAILYFLAWYWYPVSGEKVSMNTSLLNDDNGNYQEDNITSA